MHTINTTLSLALAAYRRSFPTSQVSDNQFASTFLTHDVDSDTGRLYPKGEYTSDDESPLSTLHMYSVEAAQLLEAGYTFTMADAPTPFDDDSGELHGVKYEAGPETNERSNEFAELIGLVSVDVDKARWMKDDSDEWIFATNVTAATDKRVEDNDLLDDSDRWAHEADSYIAQSQLDSHRIAMPIPASGRDFGEQGAAALRRYRRCGELVHCASKLGTQLRSARRKGNRVAINRCLSLLSRVRTGVRARYAASVKLVVTRGEASGNDSSDWDWWMLYLTKAQTERIYKEVTRALGR